MSDQLQVSERITRFSINVTFLETGLIDYEKDYFPLDTIEKRPGELYYNDAIQERLITATPYQDRIDCDASPLNVRQYTPGMRSLSINGVTQEEIDEETIPQNLAFMAGKKFVLASGQTGRLPKSSRLLANALMGTRSRGVSIDSEYLGARWRGVLLGATTASTAIVAWNGSVPWLIQLQSGSAFCYRITLSACAIALLENTDLPAADIVQRRAYALATANPVIDSREQCGEYDLFGSAIIDGWASKIDGSEASIVTLQVDEFGESGGIQYIKNYRHRLYTATVSFADPESLPDVQVVEVEDKQGFVRDKIWIPVYELGKTVEKNLADATLNPFPAFGSEIALWCYYDAEDELRVLRYDHEHTPGPGIDGFQNVQQINDFALCGTGTRTDYRIDYNSNGFTHRGFYIEDVVDARADAWVGTADYQTLTIGSYDPYANPDDFEDPLPGLQGGPTNLGTIRNQANPSQSNTPPRFCGLGGTPGSFSGSGTLNLANMPSPNGLNNTWYYTHSTIPMSGVRDAFIGQSYLGTTLIFPFGASDAVYIVQYAGLSGTATRSAREGLVFHTSTYEGNTSGAPNGNTVSYVRKQAWATISRTETVTQEQIVETKPVVRVTHIGDPIVTENGPAGSVGLSTWISWIQPPPELLLRDETFWAYSATRTPNLIHSQTFNSTYPWPKRLVSEDDWIGDPAEQDGKQTGFLGWVGHI